ncbi:hypothetical protein [Paenibacillus nasutitermitis]|uniref:Uncharacterized protein n=1 Tax=Paenibacillus nasutitermitis TaxID=1652958 RepID=A0A917DZG2_9BACL|nr:hypothetical protein [Paenibacillus nasutitermitis]GGD82161.1 hypothetical protein GCM10010911_45350 [Paenibacillus nasutitermitis]
MDETSRKKGYKENAKSDTVIEYKMVKLVRTSENQAVVSIQFTYSDLGVIPEIPYSVIKENDDWKVLLKPIEINLNKDSGHYGEIKEGIPVYELQKHLIK